ncbi:hypothetical protein HMN09_00966100 [Mycena chlorophos]|uniref:Uncharacterized protein n=1 Tax=Mycena chlorophos TaxID=658473 RepID=A0A8H6SJT3_MYCCL|nr:hypothetical protein HMN09_00966100 [Mycena chlorophos]
MSLLPTPPSTQHRASKENRAPRPRVEWSPENHTRTFRNDDEVSPTASKSTPAKSILKKSTDPILPLIDAFQREATPEPSRPEEDPSYLASSVAVLADSDASLDDLIRAYSVLAARLRAHVTVTSDPKCPLLAPIRTHRSAVSEAMMRDLRRCTVDPESMDPCPEDMEEEEQIKEQRQPLLPSPKKSPKKKKGTTARKAKYGRDLCTTCHSVLKLLGVVFTLPAVYNLFDVHQQRAIFTEVLGIPLADELPTPNTRKTYALAIWLLQTQRLPASVLEGAADRIIFALKRGIDGELGKEGKKGSASDGLKAIHDLCIYQPAIFVPKFESLVDSVLANLLAPTLAIRTQACHALGGLARGLTELPISPLHARISVWALTAISALLVLANSGAYANVGAKKVFCALLPLALKHKKSSIRTLTCTVWRIAAWAYCQPLLPPDGGDESEIDEEGGSAVNHEAIQTSRTDFWGRLLQSTVDMGVGTSTIAALLQESEDGIEQNISRAVAVLKSMTVPGKNNNLPTAIEVLARMVSFDEKDIAWSWSKMLPRSLLTAVPGLLTAEYSALETPVKNVMMQCPEVTDVRPLTREEMGQTAVFDKLVTIWRECVGCLGLQDNEPVQPNIVNIWRQLLRAHAKENSHDRAFFAVDKLLDILNDANMDMSAKRHHVPCTDGPETKNELSNAALKVRLVRALWTPTRQVCRGSQLSQAAEKLVFHLMQGEDEFTDCGEASRVEWAMLCAEVLLVCAPENVQEFWKYEASSKTVWEWTSKIRKTVWRCFAECWSDDETASWPTMAFLLALPYRDEEDWDLQGPDLELWDALLDAAIPKGFDYGLNDAGIVDHAANILAGMRHENQLIGTARVVDALLTKLTALPQDDKEDGSNNEHKLEFRELPEQLLYLTNEVLGSCYPPKPRDRQQALWTLRTVSRTVELCPIEHVLDLLRLLESSLCKWLSDECEALTDADYLYDMVNIYEVFLMKIGTLPRELDVLASTGTIFVAPFLRKPVHPAIPPAFADFWADTYASDFPAPDAWPEEIVDCLSLASLDNNALSPTFNRPASLPSRPNTPPPAPIATSLPRFSIMSTPPAPPT